MAVPTFAPSSTEIPHEVSTHAMAAAARISSRCRPDVKEIWQQLIDEILSLDLATTSSPNFASRLFFDLLPSRLVEAHGEQVALRAFHLVDGLRREPDFTRALVDLNSDSIEHVEDAEGFLFSLLAPICEEPLAIARQEQCFSGSPSVEVFDLRPHAPESTLVDVVPVAPRVFVARFNGQAHGLAIACDKRGESRVLGCCPRDVCSTSDEDIAIAADITIAHDVSSIDVDGRCINVPAIGEIRSALALPAGFVVVLPRDGQRIWILSFEGTR